MKNPVFTPFFLVWTKPVDDVPATKVTPIKTYDTIEKAMKVCDAMTIKHPNKKFFVMQAVHRSVHVE